MHRFINSCLNNPEIRAFLFLPFILTLLACSTPAEGYQSYNPESMKTWTYGDVDGVKYTIYVPETRKPLKLLLALPGWKLKATDWVHKTDLQKYADREGYILILLEMHTSIYASQYYPQTKMKWHKMAGGQFIKERFIPEMQNRFGLIRSGHENYLLGLSTGGRGVAMIALENPGLFIAGSALSGDFDQSVMPGDRLMAAVYGPYKSNKDLWEGRDNPAKRASEWTMPLYLSHGKKDKVVPYNQSVLFYEAIRKAKGESFPVVLEMPADQAHDYKFWNYGLKGTFQFFKRTDTLEE